MSICLILEGGGTRGAYTAGVLDVLTENNIFCQTIYGVSAGACNALSYISKQSKRNYEIFTKYACDKRYMSFSSLLKTGSLFGFEFIFGELADKLLPFDYGEFFKSSMNIFAGATDCETGKAVFFDKKDMEDDFKPLIASSSLPMVTNIVDFRGKYLLDGGVVAPIPIDYAIKDGFEKSIVVLTRENEYRKKKSDVPKMALKMKYREYPELVKAMINRADVYNSEKELCYFEQEKGNAFVIEPSRPVTIGRYCTKPDKLEELYHLGVTDAKNKLADLRRFIALNSL